MNTDTTKRLGGDLSHEERVPKKPRVDISSSLGHLKELSAMSEGDFAKEIPSKITEIISLFETLKETLQSQPDVKKEIQSFKSKIITIQDRIQETYQANDPQKEEVIGKIDQLLSSIKNKNSVSKEIQSLINYNKAEIDFLWGQQHVQSVADDNGTSLIISDAMKNNLDDTLFEKILKFTPESTLKTISYFDFARHPKLSSKAIGLLIAHCPHIQPKSFQSALSYQFCDHTLLVGEEGIPVNKTFLIHFSHYFKALFNFNKNETQTTILKEADPKIVKNCIGAITGLYNVEKENNLNDILAMLHQIQFFELPEELQTAAQKAAINTLQRMEGHPDDMLENAICEINKQFFPYFNNELYLDLRAQLVKIGKPLLEKLALKQGFSEGMSDKEAEDCFLALLSELDRIKFPTTIENIQVLKDKLVKDLSLSNPFGNCDDAGLCHFFNQIHLLDPLDLHCAYTVGIFYKGNSDQDDKYQKAKQIFETALGRKNIEPDLLFVLQLAYVDLLQTGAKTDPFQIQKGKEILEKLSQNDPKDVGIALMQLLMKENPTDNLKKVYDLLIPTLIQDSPGSQIYNHYFQFLALTKGFAYPRLPEIALKLIQETSKENSLEVTACNLLWNIYQSDPIGLMKISDPVKRETFNQAIMDEKKIGDVLPALRRSFFFQTALDVIEVLRSHNLMKA